ncbi:MAG: peptidoglycan-binding protein [Xanthomonadaceae bacterium]|nr:peptidoglycan-binding protein [Xanthomonadaceae bacterium]
MTDRAQERFDEARERFVRAANAAGIDPEVMVKIAGFESRGYNPDARPISRNPDLNTVRQFDGTMAMSSAHGYGQFLNGTWQEMVNRYGEKYGIEGASTMDRAQANAPELRNNRDLQASMLAEFTRENMERIRGIAGPNPDANVYAMHNLGTQGGERFLRALQDNPDALVTANGLMSNDIVRRNQSLYMDGDRTLTVREAYDRMGQQLAPYQRFADQVAGRAQPEPGQTAPGQTPSGPSAPNRNDPLADGQLQRTERGEAVRELQQNLTALGVQFRDGQGRPIGPTGFYGEQTQTAVHNFQGANNLPQTGIADETTRRAIETAARERTQGQPNPAQPNPTPANPAEPTAPRANGPQSFDDAMRTMMPPQNGTAPHITSHFGHRTLNGRDDNHGGVDFNYTGGQSGTNLQHPTVRSPVSGVVVYGEGQGSYGTVKIRDDQGNTHEILHLDSRSVRVTDPPTRVEAGDPIGTMGGRGPNGPNQYAQHVHYQVRDPNNNLVDPEAFWNNPQRRQGQETPQTQPPQPDARTAQPPTQNTVPPPPVDQPSAQAPRQDAPTAPPARQEPPADRPNANVTPPNDRPANDPREATPPPQTNQPNAPRSEAMNDGVLRRGESGPEVGQYQRILADLGYRGADGKPLQVDEKFGPNTEFAAKQFQRDHGIEQLGVIGPKTRSAADEAGRELVTHPDNPNNALYKKMLEKVHEAEDGRKIPHGEHSRNLAAALTVEAVRERVTNVDRVDFNRDGSMARAVQFSQMGDKFELNRTTDGLATQQAVRQPIKESSEQVEQVANNVRSQQREERQQTVAQGR